MERDNTAGSAVPDAARQTSGADRFSTVVAAQEPLDRVAYLLLIPFALAGLAIAVFVAPHPLEALVAFVGAAVIYGAELRFLRSGGLVWLLVRAVRSLVRFLLRRERHLMSQMNDAATPEERCEAKKQLSELRSARARRIQSASTRRNAVWAIAGSGGVLGLILVLVGVVVERTDNASTQALVLVALGLGLLQVAAPAAWLAHVERELRQSTPDLAEMLDESERLVEASQLSIRWFLLFGGSIIVLAAGVVIAFRDGGT